MKSKGFVSRSPQASPYSNKKPDLSGLELMAREDLIKLIRNMASHGVALSFNGRRTATEIIKKVRPRGTRRETAFNVGSPEEQAKNMIIEGENLQAMVTLYKYRGQVDLIVTDPPYNTGQQFRYNDKWDEDPNDPDLGSIVTKEDGSRHTKWIKAMYPRLQMMKAMLKPNGVIAICIDENELFHLGMMMDEIFKEENRIAIINWQKTYSPKNDSGHVSVSTEYVLVYAKDKEKTNTRGLDRTEAMNTRYSNPDNDPEGVWRPDNLTGGAHKKPEDFGIMSPFTGEIHYPPHRWRKARNEIKKCLEQWGSEYKSLNDPACSLPSLVLKGTKLVNGRLVAPQAVIKAAQQTANHIRETKPWPEIYFSSDGNGRPTLKRYLKNIKKGRVATTYWADEDYEDLEYLGSQSWEHQESGHTQAGLKELNAILGPGHGFQTVKPLKLIKKLIHLWCPPNGLVLDPYGGSGTTAHAILELNAESGSDRRFILIEQGRPETGDKYARTLTYERIRRVILGLRPDKNGRLSVLAEPLGGGFEFRVMLNQIDAKAVLAMRREDLIDVVITSHWEDGRRNSPNLIRIDDKKYVYLVAKDDKNEGYFVIWNGDGVGALNIETFNTVLADAKKANISPPFHVYARYEIFQSPNVRFYKIPDKILAHLGFNENTDRFNENESEV